MRFGRALIILCLISAAAPVTATIPAPSASIRTSFTPQQQLFCTPAVLTICGLQVPIDDTAALGTILNLALPPVSPNLNTRPFSVECLNYGVTSGYQLLNPESMDCQLPKCSETVANVCSLLFSVPGGIEQGNSADIQIAPDFLNESARPYPHTFSARCVGNADGSVTYQFDDIINISCNDFVCQPQTLQVCGAPVDVPGGAAMGAVFTMTMPQPAAPDPFTIECLGSEGRAPVYQVVDSSSLTCQPQ